MQTERQLYFIAWQSHLTINASPFVQFFRYALGELLRARETALFTCKSSLGRLRCSDLRKRIGGGSLWAVRAPRLTHLLFLRGTRAQVSSWHLEPDYRGVSDPQFACGTVTTWAKPRTKATTRRKKLWLRRRSSSANNRLVIHFFKVKQFHGSVRIICSSNSDALLLHPMTFIWLDFIRRTARILNMKIKPTFKV